MTDAVIALSWLGLAWALLGCFVLHRRLRAVEQALTVERTETAARLEALESLARDRWLAEATTLGGQVTAMIEALEAAASRNADAVQERQAELRTLLEWADRRVNELRALAEAPPSPDVPFSAPTRRVAPHRAGPAPGRPAPVTTDETTVAPAPALVQRHRLVRRLAADGLPPAEIARRTGLGVAEIDLILRLARPEPLQHSA